MGSKSEPGPSDREYEEEEGDGNQAEGEEEKGCWACYARGMDANLPFEVDNHHDEGIDTVA